MSSDKIEEIPKLLKDAASRQYIPSDKLGAGGFASVFRSKIIDRRTVPEASECALKVVRTKIESQQVRTRFHFELAIHNKLQHPNIVGFYRAFTHQDLTYVSLELCENGSLTDMVKRRKYLTMGEIRRFLIQLCGAVKYLHMRDVVHRDIKAGNIFLDAEMNVKLGDFGLASVMVQSSDLHSYTRRTTFCGTPNYLAPEVLSRRGHDKAVDIWAVGILAYYLAVGRAPFHSKSKDEIYEKVRKADYAWPDLGPDSNEIPEDLKGMVGKLLVREEHRPTADEIVRLPFFKYGFIPDKIEPLARTRRPRFGRMPQTGSESSQVYEDLCRESKVGIAEAPALPTSTSRKRKKRDHDEEDILAIAAEKEFSAGVHLQVPLPDNFVYYAWVKPQKKVAPSPIFENEEVEKARRPEPAEEPLRSVSRASSQGDMLPPPVPTMKRPQHHFVAGQDHPIQQAEVMLPPTRPMSAAGGVVRPDSRQARTASTTSKPLAEPSATSSNPSSSSSRTQTKPAAVPSLRTRKASTRKALGETTGNRNAATDDGKTEPAGSTVKGIIGSLSRAKRPRRAGACYE